MLGQFTAELCDSVFEQTDASSRLAALEHSNLLIARLEHGGWFRVHPLFAEFAESQLAARDAGAGLEIHRRAALWFLDEGLVAEAVEHAAAARDYDLLATIVSDHHLAAIRSGSAHTLVRWAKMLPDEKLVEHPELAMAAATAVSLAGPRTIERRRFLQLAERGRREGRARFTPYVDAGIKMVRAFTFDEGVDAGVEDGRRAVEIAERDADDVLVASLASLAHALYFADDLVAASAAAQRALAHPEAERRPTAHAIARATLALVDVDRGLFAAARAHAEKAKAVIGAIHSSRSWVGAVAYATCGVVEAAEGKLVEAERELVSAERFFHDELPTIHHPWLLLILARVRCRRGRLNEASNALHLARLELGELEDSGMLPKLAAEVERELEQASARADRGEVLASPSEAELAVLRLLTSELSARDIGGQLFLSANTVPHTRERSTGSSASTPAQKQSRARRRSAFWTAHELTHRPIQWWPTSSFSQMSSTARPRFNATTAAVAAGLRRSTRAKTKPCAVSTATPSPNASQIETSSESSPTTPRRSATTDGTPASRIDASWRATWPTSARLSAGHG